MFVAQKNKYASQSDYLFDCDQQIQFSLFKKSCSSNLLVDKIKSIVVLRVLELSLGLSDIFSKCKVCIKTLLVFSNKLQLKLPKVLRRVHLSLTIRGQWRRKCSVFQDLIKKAKLSTSMSTSKGLKSQFLLYFFFWRTPYWSC